MWQARGPHLTRRHIDQWPSSRAVVFSDSVQPLNSESRIAQQSDRIDIKDRVMADTEKTPAMLLDELVA